MNNTTRTKKDYGGVFIEIRFLAQTDVLTASNDPFLDDGYLY